MFQTGRDEIVQVALLHHHMRPLDLAVKARRYARPIHDVHADRQVAFGEGFLEVVQRAGFFKQILRVAQHEVEIAGIVAKRHTRSNVVTASIDHMNFLAPVYVGDLLILEARINCTGRTSMEVEVEIRAEDLDTGEVRAVGNSFLTMVALGEDGRPTEIPPIVPETEEERRRFEEGQERRKRRLEELGKGRG